MEQPYRYSHTIGQLSLIGLGFSNPLDAAVSDNGLLYVINRSNFDQEPFSVRVSVCRTTGEFLGRFAEYGTGDGEITWPSAITVDHEGLVYVADEHRHDIQVFSSEGTFLRRFGSFGCEEGKLNRPSGLAVDRDGSVLVVDHGNHRVCRFAANGTFVHALGWLGSEDGAFQFPWGIALDTGGRILVADWRNDRIQVFDRDGWHLRSMHGGPNGLARPSSVAVDHNGRICVAEWGADRVRVLDADGRTLAVLVGDSGLSLRAAQWLAADPEVARKRMACNLEVEKRFWGPTAVAVDRDGRIYVVDSCRHRIQVYERVAEAWERGDRPA